MLQLPTVILHHQTLAGSHYDWLWLDSVTRDQLLGFRLALPPSQWESQKSLLMQPLPPHRLIYLTYQGPISGGRGQVTQVAKGHVKGWPIGQHGWDWQLHITRSKTTKPIARIRIMPIDQNLWQGKVHCPV